MQIVDLSHYDWEKGTALDFKKAALAGIGGVIYKATEGATYQDQYFIKTRQTVLDAGLLFGVFHFCTAAAPDSQVQNFLDTTTPDANTLVCVDFEHNDPHPDNTTTAEIGRTVLQSVRDKLNRIPTLYTGALMYDLFGETPQPDLSAYPLWWSEYQCAAPKLHPTWQSYKLWQFSEQQNIPGLGACDCSVFNGDMTALRTYWFG